MSFNRIYVSSSIALILVASTAVHGSGATAVAPSASSALVSAGRLSSDINADGRDDIISFTRGPRGGGTAGDIYVSMSSGISFAQTGLRWHEDFSYGEELPLVGDFNGDGRYDVASFTRGPRGGANAGKVYVALSTGSSFAGTAVRWHEEFGFGGELPAVGDFNGDGRDDIASFTRGPRGGTNAGKVYVALSTGTSFAGTDIRWHEEFGFGGEVPRVGDFNGDGRDDIASFTRGPRGGTNAGKVYVALSTGTSFAGTDIRWHEEFAFGEEIPDVGDFNGDGRDDIVTFVRGPRSSSGGNVYVALSTGLSFTGTAQLWNGDFCFGEEIPGTGDFNGDGRDDIVTFVRNATRNSVGDVYVSRSNGSSFVDSGALWNGNFSFNLEVPQPSAIVGPVLS